MDGVIIGFGLVGGMSAPLALGPVAGPFIRASLIILLILAIYALVEWVQWRKFAGRRIRVAAVAKRLGLRFSPQDPLGCVRLPFDALGRGEGRGAENVLWGSWRGLDVRGFDSWRRVETSQGQAIVYRSCVVTRLPIRGPKLTIARHHMMRDLGHLESHAVPFESEDFNRTFLVRSTDPKFATDVVDPRMMQWLLGTNEDVAIEVSDEWLMAWHPLRVKPKEIPAMLGVMKGFVDHVPPVVHDLYPPPPGADGRERGEPVGAGAVEPIADDSGAAFWRNRWWGQRWAWIAAAVFLAAWVGTWIVAGVQCAGDPTCDVPAGAASDPTVPTTAPTTVPPTLSAALGSSLTLVGDRPGERVTVTVERMIAPPKGEGANHGERTVGMLVAVRNAGTIRYHETDFSGGAMLVEADGARTVVTIFEPSLHNLDVVRLPPGGSVTGDLWFDIPTHARPATLLLTPDGGFGPQTGRWSLPG